MRRLIFLLLLVLAATPALTQEQIGGGIYNATPPTLSDKQRGPFQLDTNGNLKVTSQGTPSSTQNVNILQVGSGATATGHGTAAGALRVELPTDGTGAVGLNAGSNTIGTVNAAALAPVNSTMITASATGTTAATTATLAATGGKTTYICGFSIRADATAAATGNATVSNTITGTMNFTQWTAPLASGVGITEEQFFPCIPANAVNTTIPVASAAPGSGGTVSVSAWGYQQ